MLQVGVAQVTASRDLPQPGDPGEHVHAGQRRAVEAFGLLRRQRPRTDQGNISPRITLSS